MKLEDFKKWALSHGWKEDRYGHLQKTIGEKEYRFHLSPTSVRDEVKTHFADGGNDWTRLRSNYLKNLFITAEGKLSGLKP